jgi:hypothetical protein
MNTNQPSPSDRKKELELAYEKYKRDRAVREATGTVIAERQRAMIAEPQKPEPAKLDPKLQAESAITNQQRPRSALEALAEEIGLEIGQDRRLRNAEIKELRAMIAKQQVEIDALKGATLNDAIATLERVAALIEDTMGGGQPPVRQAKAVRRVN